MINKIKLSFGTFSLRTRILVYNIILITIPVLIISSIYYFANLNMAINVTERDIYQLVKSDNELLDTKLQHVTDSVNAFITDKDLVHSFMEIKPDSDSNILLLDDKVSNIVGKYFLQSADIYSSQLVTSYLSFSQRTPITTVKGQAPKDAFINSELYRIAKDGKGNIRWVPTYDFVKMFKLNYLKDINFDYRYMFSAVIQVNGACMDEADYICWNPNIEKPVFVLNFKEDFFHKIFNDNISTNGGYFFIVTKDGQIVSHQDQTKLTEKISDPWIKDICSKKSGTKTMEIDGKKMVVVFDTSKVTDWTLVYTVTVEYLSQPIWPVIKYSTLYLSIILILVAIIVSYFISVRVTGPINKVIEAIKKTGEGNFNLKVEAEGTKESNELIYGFNIMNKKIQKLIEENYVLQLKEKEAEITALNLQLDPHFMFNTLNLINMISIENDQEEISSMLVSLSTMLRYTVKAGGNLVCFNEDMRYLKGYIFLMEKRFEGKFTVTYNIDTNLDNTYVPKFFLQPFVENTFIHGFDDLKRGGLLKITCWIEGSNRYFCIEDNGCGIDEERINKIFSGQLESVGISNVNKRIKIIYGTDYGINIKSELNQFTKITIKLPHY